MERRIAYNVDVMKFLITGKPEQMKKMKKDLDKEIRKTDKAQKTQRFKKASRILEKITKMPVVIVMNYNLISDTTIELNVTMTGEDKRKKQIRKEIERSAKSYGDNVTIEIL
jgi:hypothetical protein